MAKDSKKPNTLFLCERVRLVRREKNLTQEDLAYKSGCSSQAMEWIESGMLPRPRNIYALARALEVNPAWLQFGDQWAHRKPPSNFGN